MTVRSRSGWKVDLPSGSATPVGRLPYHPGGYLHRRFGLMGIGMRELIIILLVVLLVFGAKKLRTIGSDLGAAVRGFKKSVSDGESEETPKQIGAEGADADFPTRPRAGRPSRRATARSDAAASAPARHVRGRLHRAAADLRPGAGGAGARTSAQGRAQVGNWVGRARAMARQFREQLEDEARLDEVITPDPPRRRRRARRLTREGRHPGTALSPASGPAARTHRGFRSGRRRLQAQRHAGAAR